jgi:hypothetical protein
MRTSILLNAILFIGCLPTVAAEPLPPNTLTDTEKAAGWRLLWDGKSADGWRMPRTDSFPTKGWQMTNGILMVLSNGGGGDIISKERFSQFELMVDFKITERANSGIKYFVQPNLSAVGLEFQILDDARHPDAKAGRNGNRTLGSLYDLIPATTSKQSNPIGEWNTARIVSTGKRVEHWLNGVKVLQYERGSDEYRRLVAASKYKDIPQFGEWADGHILLQDHGDCVSFRNIKIRVPVAN